MSNKVQETQGKKGRLGRGLNSLLGGGNLATSSEELVEKKQQPVAPSASVQQQKTNISAASTGVKAATTVTATPVSTTENTTTHSSAVTTGPAPTVVQVPPEARIWKIAVDKLNPNEYQPRQKFNKETLAELAASIKDKGILQPIIARRHLNGILEIISGERRWRAAQIAGLHEVPVIIKSVSDQDSLELAIIENIQREDLNPIDEAEAYQRLADEFKLTQQQIAEKVSKERATVANSMRLLALPSSVREMLSQQEITAGHAKVLLSLNDPKTQHQLAKKVLANKLSVRALEKLIQGIQKQPNQTVEELDSKEKTKVRLAEAAALELQRLVGTKVSIDYSAGKGKITLAFYSDEEFNNIVEKMKKSWQK
jgi:ParB family chromosome partitioning protein